MKKIYILIPILFLVLSCNTKINSEELKNINGYWEVTLVETPDVEDKEYNVPTSVDYIEIKENKGFRQKVVPQIDGKFLTNNIKELVVVKDSANATYLNYTTNYAKWSEKIIKLTNDVLVTENDQDIIYHYKRYEPIKIE